MTEPSVSDEDFDDPDLIQTPAAIDALLVAFGKEAAGVAEYMTEEDTAAYLTAFLRHVVARLTGIEPPPPPSFKLPKDFN